MALPVLLRPAAESESKMGSLLRRIREAFQPEKAEGRGRGGALFIRPMARGDLDAVVSIERASFPSPWRRQTYERAILGPSHNFFVAELDGLTVGYVGFWVEGPQAHIAKIAVHQDYRRRGIGTRLLRDALDRVRRLGLRSAFLEVRRTNTPAQNLYRRFGFRFRSVKPHAYPNDGEDALVFARDDLLEPASP